MKIKKYREPAGQLNFGLFTKKVPLTYADIVNAAEMANSNRKINATIEQQRRKEAKTQQLNTSTITAQDNTNVRMKEPSRTYEQAKQDFENKAHYTGTIEPYNQEKHEGWMEVDPKTGDPTWHTPEYKNAEPPSEISRMLHSPAFQLLLSIPFADLPFILKNANYNGVPFAEFEEVPLDFVTKQSGNVSVPAIENDVEPLQIIQLRQPREFTIDDARIIDSRERALAKIRGFKDYATQDEFADDVTKGLTEPTQNMLRHNMVERYKNAYLAEGGDPGYLYQIDEIADNAMKNVNVGRYSAEDYAATGATYLDGFYEPARNFISLNKDAFIEPHEGLHLLYNHLKISELQFDKLMQAYGQDFLNLPKTGFSGRIERLESMKDEMMALNWDGRSTLLKENIGQSLEVQNQLIKQATPTQVYNAIAESGPYGNHFVKYLYSKGLCTPERAEAIKDAMIYVGSLMPFIMRGNSTYNYIKKSI